MHSPRTILALALVAGLALIFFDAYQWGTAGGGF